MQKRIISIAILAMVALTLTAAKSGSSEFPKAGEKARFIRLQKYDPAEQKLTGEYVSITTEARANDAVIFSFFNPTCIPCEKEIPELQSILAEFEEHDVQLYLIWSETLANTLTPEQIEAMDAFIEKIGITATILFDHYANAADRYKITGLTQGGGKVINPPATFIADNEAVLQYAQQGFNVEDAEKYVTDWRAVLTTLTAE